MGASLNDRSVCPRLESSDVSCAYCTWRRAREQVLWGLTAGTGIPGEIYPNSLCFSFRACEKVLAVAYAMVRQGFLEEITSGLSARESRTCPGCRGKGVRKNTVRTEGPAAAGVGVRGQWTERPRVLARAGVYSATNEMGWEGPHHRDPVGLGEAFGLCHGQWGTLAAMSRPNWPDVDF